MQKTSSGSSKTTKVSKSVEKSILNASGHSINPLPVGTTKASSKGGMPISFVSFSVKKFSSFLNCDTASIPNFAGLPLVS